MHAEYEPFEIKSILLFLIASFPTILEPSINNILTSLILADFKSLENSPLDP